MGRCSWKDLPCFDHVSQALYDKEARDTLLKRCPCLANMVQQSTGESLMQYVVRKYGHTPEVLDSLLSPKVQIGELGLGGTRRQHHHHAHTTYNAQHTHSLHSLTAPH